MIETLKYARNAFFVDAVQVTGINIEELAQWCNGTLIDGDENSAKHIKVDVHRPNTVTERQKMAFLGDWLLKAGSGFKVYTDRAFKKSFHLESDETFMHSPHEVIRDAGTGQFVTEEYAEANPNTTVHEAD